MAEGAIRIAINVEGLEKFKALRARLKEAESSLRVELIAAIKVATQPLEQEVKQSIARLPRRGGLADKVAGAKFTTRVSTTSVRFKMASPYYLDEIDKGKLAHPVFGRKPNVFQKVNPGFWTDPIRNNFAPIETKVVGVIDEFGRKLDH